MPGHQLLLRWARAPHWRPEEGVALAFGLDPTEVREARFDYSSQLKLSEKKKIAHLEELARRAVEAGDLPERARPFQFVNWAERIGLRFHRSWTASFVERTNDQSHRIENDQEQRHRQARSARQADRGEMAQVRTQEEITKPELSQRTKQEQVTAEDKPLQTRPRETMLKIMIGMAVVGYNYDPRAKRSDIPGQIAEDLAAFGIGVTAETVRKYLAEGAQFLSSEDLRNKFDPK